jgi:hypothetical protein
VYGTTAQYMRRSAGSQIGRPPHTQTRTGERALCAKRAVSRETRAGLMNSEGRTGRANGWAGGRDRCSGCTSARRAELDAQIVAGISQRQLAKDFGLSRSAIQRHLAHVSASLVRVEGPRSIASIAPGSVTNSDDVVVQARQLYEACRGAFDRAIESGNPLSLSLAAREARAGLELLGRLLQRLEQRRVVGVLDLQGSSEWGAIRSVIMDALKDQPGLRVEIAARLKALDTPAPSGNGNGV